MKYWALLLLLGCRDRAPIVSIDLEQPIDAAVLPHALWPPTAHAPAAMDVSQLGEPIRVELIGTPHHEPVQRLVISAPTVADALPSDVMLVHDMVKRTRSGTIRLCLAKKAAIVHGRMTLAFTIGSDGAVSGMEVSLSSGDLSLDQCISRVVGRVLFPAPNAPVRVSAFPLEFQ